MTGRSANDGSGTDLGHLVEGDEHRDPFVWFRIRHGQEGPKKGESGWGVPDSPSFCFFVESEPGNQPGFDHLIKKAALLCRHLLDDLLKFIGIHGRNDVGVAISSKDDLSTRE